MNLVIDGSVTGSGRPSRMHDTNRGITEPREYMTLPYLTQETVGLLPCVLHAQACATFSISAFVMPIALMG